MPLPISADSLDAVPEAARSFYIQKDGKYHLDAPIEDVSGLKAAQRTALAEKKQLEEKLAAALGDAKLDDVAAIIKAHRQAEDDKARKAGDVDKLIEKRVNETKAEYEKRVAALESYKQKYEDRELESAIRKAAIPAGVDPKDLEEYVIPLVKGRRVKLDGDKIVVIDKDGDATGLSVEKFFAETFKAEAPKFYQAAGGSGGGAGQGSSANRTTGGALKVTDAAGLLANLNDVAAGKVKVQAA